MSVWREVQETLYQRWRDQWGATTPYAFGNETFDPPAAPWARVVIQRMPGGPGTLGRKGNRKMDRVGLLFILLREPPGEGVGRISDLGEQAAAIYENCRLLANHDVRFGEVEPGEAGEIENGRWWGLSVEGRFDYEDIR